MRYPPQTPAKFDVKKKRRLKKEEGEEGEGEESRMGMDNPADNIQRTLHQHQFSIYSVRVQYMNVECLSTVFILERSDDAVDYYLYLDWCG